MIRGLQHRLVRVLQRRLAKTSYRRHAKRPPARPISWVVGPDEVANMVASIASAIPGSYSVSLTKHPFYADAFDYGGASPRRGWALQMLSEAWHFGRIAAAARGVIYVGPAGFLRAQDDAREFEFGFLSERGAGIVCYFTGSDIRSIPVMAEMERRSGRPNIATYLPALSPVFSSGEYDLLRKRLAATADRYADAVFNASADQSGYLTRETMPFRYFYPDDRIADPRPKFASVERPVVLHAPSSPIIKGTQLVRAAVAALREEGLDFEYVELSGVPHAEVERELLRAHIVMNEFYSSMPGVFGVEAMAAGAVLLTAADEETEPDLPPGSNSAWVPTRHHEVTERLRAAITAPPEALLAQAEAGQRWLRAHATARASGEVVRQVLEDLRPSR